MQKMFIMLLILVASVANAGKIEVKKGKKVEFYSSGPDFINIDKGIKCRGEELQEDKFKVVQVECYIDGTLVNTLHICDPTNGYGIAVLKMLTKSNKPINFSHHCNGLSI